jgi:hypothetical protein
MIDTNVKTIGSMHFCRHRTTPDSFTWYGEGALGNTPFKGVGECHGVKFDFPEQGIDRNCQLFSPPLRAAE